MYFERSACRLIDKQEKRINELTEELQALKQLLAAAQKEIRRLSAVAASSYYDSQEGQWQNRKQRRAKR